MTPCEALTRSRLANLLEAQARLLEAEQLWREALDGPLARFAAFRLATLLERHGRAAEAEQVRRDAAARRLGTAW